MPDRPSSSAKTTAKTAAKEPFLTTLRELARTYQAFSAYSEAFVRQFDLTPAQFDVIATLGNTHGMSMGELGEKTLITKGTLTGVIDRLEKKQLVQREIPADDRRSGFAASQSAYDQAVAELFQALDYWETVLDRQPYLCGDAITLADWCLFTTLFRFDLAYHGIFKCNLKRLVDYPNLWSYCRDLYQQPKVKQWCSVDHVKRIYYVGLPELNPNQIMPKGPAINFDLPHDRHQQW